MSKMVTCRNIKREPKTVEASQLQFRPSIYGVIVRDDKVLLARAMGGYDFPGGGIDAGEALDEALVREVKEETGVDVEMDKLLHVQTDFFIHPLRPETPFHSLLFYYTCKNVRGEVSTDHFHESDHQLNGELAEWVPLENIESLTFFNPVDSVALIRMAAEGKGI